MIFWVPLMQMLILVFAATFDMKNITMTIVDNDFSETSRGLIAKFDGIPFFQVNRAVLETAAAEELLLEGSADMVLVIPAGTERKLLREDEAQIAVPATFDSIR